jgi:octaprenyl-diphosphate synthase
MVSEKAASSIVDDVYRLIHEEFQSGDPLVNGIMGKALAIRGKGMRPLFMYRVACLYGHPWESVRRAAMAIEAIHIASLLHDDVVDGSKLRRGSATLNSRYSDKISVLMGDYILLKALAVTHSLGNSETAPVIQRALERMVEGEISDSLCSGIINENEYLGVIGNKTASLFAAAGEVVIILSGGGMEDRTRARDLGEYVGMAFQIVDDALDYHGDANVMGKPTFMDIQTGCLTLPLIHALRKGHPAETEDILNGSSLCAERLLSVVQESGGIEYALGQAEEYLRRAGEILDTWVTAGSRTVFDRFFETLLDRRY